MHDDKNDNSVPASAGDQSDLPALALGALDSNDEPSALAELRASDAARDELRSLEDVVGDLGLAAPQVAPSPDLRARILAATAQQAPPLSLEAERNRRTSAGLWAGAAAAALLILVLGASAYSQWSTAQDRGDRISALQAELDLQAVRIAQLEQAATSAGAFVDFEQPLVWTELAPATGGAESPGFLARTPDGEAAYLVLTGVDVDPAHVFQAWLIEDGPVSVGTFRPDASGLGFLILEHSGGPVHAFSLIGVSVEPPGGSPQPTTDPIIVAEIV